MIGKIWQSQEKLWRYAVPQKTEKTFEFYKRCRFSEPFNHQNRYSVPTLFVENRDLDHFLRFGEPTPFLAIAIIGKMIYL